MTSVFSSNLSFKPEVSGFVADQKVLNLWAVIDEGQKAILQTSLLIYNKSC